MNTVYSSSIIFINSIQKHNGVYSRSIATQISQNLNQTRSSEFLPNYFQISLHFKSPSKPISFSRCLVNSDVKPKGRRQRKGDWRQKQQIDLEKVKTWIQHDSLIPTRQRWVGLMRMFTQGVASLNELNQHMHPCLARCLSG